MGAAVGAAVGAVVGVADGAAVGEGEGEDAEFVCEIEVATTELPFEPTPETCTSSPTYGLAPLYVVE